MFNTRPYTLIIRWFVLFLTMHGCATPTGLDDNIKQELGTIGITGYQFQVNKVLIQNSHGKIRGTAEGAAAGFLLPIVAGLYEPDPLSSLLVMVTAPFFAVGGAIYGGIVTDSPLPPETVELNQNKIDASFSALDVQEILRDQIGHFAREQTIHNIIILTGHGPTDDSSSYDYTSLTVQGIDSVLEAGFSRIETTEMVLGETGLIIHVDARLINLSDRNNIFHKQYQFVSFSYSLAEWGEDDARLIKETFENAAGKIAREITKDFMIIRKNAKQINSSVFTENETCP